MSKNSRTLTTCLVATLALAPLFACSSAGPNPSPTSLPTEATPYGVLGQNQLQGIMLHLPVTSTPEGLGRGAFGANNAFTPPNVPPPYPANGSPPHLSYWGGRVVSNAQIVQVDWNSGGSFDSYVVDGEMGAFYAGITDSRYFDWLEEYDTLLLRGQDGKPGSFQTIGRGTFAGKFDITPSIVGTSVTDAQIQTELSAQIASGQLPPATTDAHGNVNTIYFVHFPLGTSITSQGQLSCQRYCAYHNSFVNAPDGGGSTEVYYSVMPDFRGAGCERCEPNHTAFETATVVASHELTETVTDPEIGILIANGPTVDDGGAASLRPDAWYYLSFPNGGEIGDICRSSPTATVPDARGTNWTVQRLWSNYSGECVVSHLSNGGFEGNRVASLNSWLASGVAATTPFAHKGRGALLLGSLGGGPISGDSSASQTFDLPDPYPAGTVTLSAWYSTSCSDPQTGWFRASLVDVMTGNTLTLVPQGCANTPGDFTQVSIDVTPLHGRTVTLSFANEDTGGSTRTSARVDDATVTANLASPSNPVANPSFESWIGSLPASWNGAGTTSRAQYLFQPTFTGRSAVMTGSTSPTSGDSSVSQTFTAQAGASTVGLWMLPACQDAVTNDWVTATLVDNTAATTAVLLPPTCTNDASVDRPLWTRVTGSVVAGHGYTITLTSHDDGVAGTATSAFWDDVSVF